MILIRKIKHKFKIFLVWKEGNCLKEYKIDKMVLSQKEVKYNNKIN